MRNKPYECPRDAPCTIENGDHVCDRVVIYSERKGGHIASVDRGNFTFRCPLTALFNKLYHADSGSSSIEDINLFDKDGGALE
jgi:hypothetical protein